MMSKYLGLSLLATMLVFQTSIMAQDHEEEPGEFRVQAFSASDPHLLASDTNCATVLKELQLYDQYRLITATNLQGPPGVLFMLQGAGKNVVLLKCGIAGSHEG